MRFFLSSIQNAGLVNLPHKPFRSMTKKESGNGQGQIHFWIVHKSVHNMALESGAAEKEFPWRKLFQKDLVSALVSAIDPWADFLNPTFSLSFPNILRLRAKNPPQSKYPRYKKTSILKQQPRIYRISLQRGLFLTIPDIIILWKRTDVSEY